MLITSGLVDLFTRKEVKFMQLPPESLFNDYQLLFSVKSNIKYVSYSPKFTDEKSYNLHSNNTITMNLDSEKFQELLDLYPETKENLKLRSLEKRSIVTYYKKKAENRTFHLR